MSRLRIYGDASGYLDLVAPDTASNQVIDLENILSLDTNSRLGIGTTSATDTLHVVGNIRAGTETQEGVRLTANENSGQIELLNNSGAIRGLIDINDGDNDDGEGVLRFLQLGTDGTEIGNENATGTVKIKTNSTSRITALASGFVGIGTDTPAYKLDVNGNLRVAGNFIVDGTTTTINSSTLNVDDVNITVANGAADAAAADGAGLTVDGASATLTYVNAGDNWSFNKDLNLDGDLTVGGGQVTMPNVATRDKYRVWNNSTYAIGMDNAISFGGLNDYAMTFQMNDQANRGYWWGDAAHTDAQGAMALTTDGKLTVAHSARIGHGEGDTTTPGASSALDVNGTVNATAFTGDGSGLTNVSSGASFTGAAGVFSNFNGNSSLALRNNFSTSTDYNVGGFTVATTGITVPSDGYYDCYVNLYMTSTIQRSNIGLRFYINTTVQDPISASNYIRAASGHNEASTNLRMILYMTAGQQFRIGTQILAVSGTVTITGANSNWIIQKVG